MRHPDINDIKQLKRQIRKEVKAQISGISLEVRQAESDQINILITQQPEWEKAKTVLAYSPLSDEPDITPTLKRILSNKRLFLPVIHGENLTIKEVTALKHLTKEKKYGIYEPTGQTFEDLNAIDIILVPGVAFTKEGYRLGRGKGFYDRLLKHTNASLWGVCFSFQLIDTIPIEPHDVILNSIITPLKS